MTEQIHMIETAEGSLQGRYEPGAIEDAVDRTKAYLGELED
jgi:hypothetical protein